MSTFVAESPLLSQLASRFAQDHSARSIVANGLVVICLVCLLTISDAFETQDLSLIHQIGLWGAVCLLLVIQLNFIQRALQKRISKSLFSLFLATIAAVIATVLLMTIELHWMKFTPLLPKQPDPLPEFLVFVAPPVAVMAALVLFVKFLSIPIEKPPASTAQLASRRRESTKSCEHGELEAIIRNNSVLHIQSHDHYLEIKCDEGRYFVRGRMKDALLHLAEAGGVQVHRSHWISSSHLRRVVREGRDMKILLHDGSVIPVARSRIAQLQRTN